MALVTCNIPAPKRAGLLLVGFVAFEYFWVFRALSHTPATRWQTVVAG